MVDCLVLAGCKCALTNDLISCTSLVLALPVFKFRHPLGAQQKPKPRKVSAVWRLRRLARTVTGQAGQHSHLNHRSPGVGWSPRSQQLWGSDRCPFTQRKLGHKQGNSGLDTGWHCLCQHSLKCTRSHFRGTRDAVVTGIAPQ